MEYGLTPHEMWLLPFARVQFSHDICVTYNEGTTQKQSVSQPFREWASLAHWMATILDGNDINMPRRVRIFDRNLNERDMDRAWKQTEAQLSEAIYCLRRLNDSSVLDEPFCCVPLKLCSKVHSSEPTRVA
jgi:hypothetical protein